MPTPAERRALFFLASLLVLGGSVRAYAALATHPTPSSLEEADLDRQIHDVDSARSRTRKPTAKTRKRHGSPRDTAGDLNVPPGTGTAQTPLPSPTQPALVRLPRPTRKPRDASDSASIHVDLDVAPAAEIERLPRIGPALARRITANRDSLGPFGSIQELQRVRGIGPALARILAPHVTFSLQPRPHRVDQPDGRGAVRKPRRSRVRVSDPP